MITAPQMLLLFCKQVIILPPLPPESSFMITESGLNMELEQNTDLMITE